MDFGANFPEDYNLSLVLVTEKHNLSSILELLMWHIQYTYLTAI